MLGDIPTVTLSRTCGSEVSEYREFCTPECVEAEPSTVIKANWTGVWTVGKSRGVGIRHRTELEPRSGQPLSH